MDACRLASVDGGRRTCGPPTSLAWRVPVRWPAGRGRRAGGGVADPLRIDPPDERRPRWTPRPGRRGAVVLLVCPKPGTPPCSLQPCREPGSGVARGGSREGGIGAGVPAPLSTLGPCGVREGSTLVLGSFRAYHGAHVRRLDLLALSTRERAALPLLVRAKVATTSHLTTLVYRRRQTTQLKLMRLWHAASSNARPCLPSNAVVHP